MVERGREGDCQRGEGGGRGAVGEGGVIGLTPTSPPPPPRPEPSTQIEMDFGVIRHTESFGEEKRERGVSVCGSAYGSKNFGP